MDQKQERGIGAVIGWLLGVVVLYFVADHTMSPGEYIVAALKAGSVGFAIGGVLYMMFQLGKRLMRGPS